MSSISKRSSALTEFVVLAASLLYPVASRAQSVAQNAQPNLPATPAGKGCELTTGLITVMRDDSHAYSFQHSDRPEVLTCANERGAVTVAAGVVTNASQNSLQAYLTNFATNAYLTNASPDMLVPLPRDFVPRSAFGEKFPFLEEFTFTAYARRNPKLAYDRPWGVTVGELYYPTTAAGVGTVAGELPQDHSTIYADVESFSSTAILGLTGGTVWVESGTEHAFVRATATAGSEFGRGTRGVTAAGDLTGGIRASAAECTTGIKVVQRARDGSGDPIEFHSGLHAECSEQLPRKLGGIDVQQIFEYNRFKNRLGYPDGPEVSKTGVVGVGKTVGHLDVRGILAAGGNTSPFGGITCSDCSGDGRYFKSAEVDVDYQPIKGIHLLGAVGAIAPIHASSDPSFTLEDLYAGQTPGEGSYRHGRGAMLGIRVNTWLFGHPAQ